MAYLDTQLQFSDAQALSATGNSTNTIDLSVARQIGSGESLVVAINLDVAMGGTTPTLQVTLKYDNNATPTTVVATSQTLSAPGAGTKIFLPVPQGISGRYMMLTYTLGGTSPTATVTAVLTSEDMVQNEAVYPTGYTVA